MMRGNVSASGQIIEMYLAQARNCLVGRLSSTPVATIIFHPDDSILPGWEKFSTSGQRI